MTTKMIDLETITLTLEALLAELDTNTEVLLMRGTDPVAKITAAAAPAHIAERILGLHEGEGWISEDFTDELADTFWLGTDA